MAKSVRAPPKTVEAPWETLSMSAIYSLVGAAERLGGAEGEGEGGTHLLLALVFRPLTTHPFRDGSTVPSLSRETSNKVGAYHVFPHVNRNFLLI